MKIKDSDVYEVLESFEGLMTLYETKSVTLCGLSERVFKLLSALSVMMENGSWRRRREARAVNTLIREFRDKIIGPSMEMTCSGAKYRIEHQLRSWNIVENIRSGVWHTPDCSGEYPMAVTLVLRTTRGQPAIFTFTAVDRGDRIETFHTVPGRFMLSKEDELHRVINILENRLNWVGVLRDPTCL